LEQIKMPAEIKVVPHPAFTFKNAAQATDFWPRIQTQARKIGHDRLVKPFSTAERMSLSLLICQAIKIGR
jgi:hypothetical protein